MSQLKVLIINQPFVSNTGGGITLSNLFSTWQPENLAVACSGYLLTDDIDPKVCNNYYQLGTKERKWIFPFNFFSRTYYSGTVKFDDRAKNKDKIVMEKSKFRDTLILKYILPVFDYLGFAHFKTKFTLSPEFKAWLDAFAPNILYTQAAGREDILLCLQIKKYTKKPLVFHMMDDWPATLGKKGFMKRYWEKKINKEFRKLLSQTEVALSISDYMAEEYLRRYGKTFTTFHNPINLDFWKKAQRKNHPLNECPTVLYAGRIGLGIDRSLKSIAEAIEKVNEGLGMQIKFALQTQRAPTWIKDFVCVQYRSFVEYEELPQVFAQADFLILPYDFSNKSIDYIKYSMPTKAPEYMVSGTPIIIFAPKDTALVKYAERLNWAKVVTKNSTELLAKAIEDLVKSETERRQIVLKAIEVAEKNHSTREISTKFERVIISAISSTNY